MRKFLIFLGTILFWYLYFVAARILFLLYNYSFSSELSLHEIIMTFVKGFKLDLSFVSYFSVLTSFIFGLFFFLNGKILYKIVFYYFSFIAVVLSLVTITDCELYRFWGFRLDATPLLYLKNPGEAMASTSFSLFVFLIIFTFFIVFITLFTIKKIFKKQFLLLGKGHVSELPLYLLMIVGFVVPIRGGLGLAPLNAGNAYFSHKPFANHAAINTAWNLSKSLLELSDPDPFIDKINRSEAEKIVQSMNPVNTDRTRLLKTKRPDIIILVLEGIPERLIDTVINGIEICPNLNSLKSESIYFNRFFANGDRSEKGLASIFSGYPNLAHTSVMKYPEKTQKLGYLSKELIKHHYAGISFYYGGNIDFANMRSYFINGGFNELISMNDFNKKLYNSKWGAHDEYVLNKWFEDLEKLKSPFFSSCFTLSSHEPFEIPDKAVIKGNDENSKFISSVHYTDKCVGDFIRKAQKSDWWDSTLIIIVSDHGHRFPGEVPYYSQDKFHVPMFWTGGAIAAKDTIIRKTVSQIDIIPTLLSQMGIKPDKFRFGHDFSNKYQYGMVLYCFNLGFGFISDNSSFIYDVKGMQTIEESSKLSVKIKNQAFSLYDVIHYDFTEK